MTTARDHITRALAGRRLLDHPFYRRWEAGELRDGELASYAAQYRHFEASLPQTLVALAAALPQGTARDAIIDNLADELGPPAHLDLFDAFAASVGADAVAPSPAMRALVDAYGATCAAGAVSGLAGVLAYEVQGAEIAASKGAGLRAHYGSRDEDCTFWDVHTDVEGLHAEWAIDALDELEWDGVVIEEAARVVASAWWSFLDEREIVGAAL